MEYFEHGDLEARMKDTTIDEVAAKEITYGILKALHHIHSMGITHRDVKPSVSVEEESLVFF